MKIKRNNDLPYVFGNAVIILMIIVTIISILIVSQEYWKPVFFYAVICVWAIIIKP